MHGAMVCIENVDSGVKEMVFTQSCLVKGATFPDKVGGLYFLIRSILYH